MSTPARKTPPQVIEDAGRFIPRADAALSEIADTLAQMNLSLRRIEDHVCGHSASRPDPFSVDLGDR